MSDDRDTRIDDLIYYGANENPIEFQQTFNDLVADRLVQFVDNLKANVAKSIFKTDDEVEEEPDGQDA